MLGFIIGSSLVLPPGLLAGSDAWIATILGMLLGLSISMVYVVLARRFPGKSLAQINAQVLGRAVGGFVTVAFAWYSLHLASLVVDDFADFWTALIFPETPRLFIAVITVVLCALAARCGIEVLARCAQVLLPLTFASVILTVVLLLPRLHLESLRPVLQTPVAKLLWASYGAAAFPFAETVVFSMVLFTLNDVTKAMRPVVSAHVFGGMMLVIATLRNITSLGATMTLHTYPSFSATRLINIADILTRLEIIVALNLLTMGFLKISVLLYSTAIAVGHTFGLKRHYVLMLPIGLLAVVLSSLNFRGIVDNVAFLNTYPVYSFPFQVAIPVVVLAVAVLRSKPKE